MTNLIFTLDWTVWGLGLVTLIPAAGFFVATAVNSWRSRSLRAATA